MHQNPTLAEALIRDRVAELRHSANNQRRIGHRDRDQGARRRIGWLLVDIGLRLAAHSGTGRPLARG